MASTDVFNPSAFRTISSLHGAYESFKSRNGDEFVETKLKPLFLQHNVVNSFCVNLVHRHFELDDGTMIVEKNNISTPWLVPENMKKHGGTVHPTSWLLYDDKGCPYEFTFVPADGKSPPSIGDHKTFVEEYFVMVKEAGLGQVLGLHSIYD
ncbi:hypothetical protein K4F52_004304 [Lecanicillium sp. MT-2017a]|nr:hypothetical protein K4F52_004304 [Lecanicillium sp. MT-2017a]